MNVFSSKNDLKCFFFFLNPMFHLIFHMLLGLVGVEVPLHGDICSSDQVNTFLAFVFEATQILNSRLI